jgi:hypothetical protein
MSNRHHQHHRRHHHPTRTKINSHRGAMFPSKDSTVPLREQGFLDQFVKTLYSLSTNPFMLSYIFLRIACLSLFRVAASDPEYAGMLFAHHSHAVNNWKNTTATVNSFVGAVFNLTDPRVHSAYNSFNVSNFTRSFNINSTLFFNNTVTMSFYQTLTFLSNVSLINWGDYIEELPTATEISKECARFPSHRAIAVEVFGWSTEAPGRATHLTEFSRIVNTLFDTLSDLGACDVTSNFTVIDDDGFDLRNLGWIIPTIVASLAVTYGAGVASSMLISKVIVPLVKRMLVKNNDSTLEADQEMQPITPRKELT